MGGFYSVSNLTPNTWAYQMFPGGTPYSITNPQDSIGNYNDFQLTNFDYTADFLERNSVAMMNNMEQLYKQYQAQIAQWSQNTYPNISGNTNVTIPGLTPGVTPGGYASKIDDDQVAGYISRLANDPLYGPELKKEVTLDDGTKVTYLKRLDDLINDYLKAKTPALSDDDFAKIKEIAGKIAKTGKITKEDFLTLKKIVDTHKGKLGAEQAAEDDAAAEEEEHAAAAEEEAKAPVANPNAASGHWGQVKSAADLYFEAMDGPGTDKDLMDEARGKTTDKNVIEIIKYFNENKGNLHAGETLIEYILDDFDCYKGIQGRGFWGTWLRNDKAKPYITKLTDSLKTRAEGLQELKKNGSDELKLSEATRNDLKAKVNAMNTALNRMTDTHNTFTETDKNEIETAFNNLVEAIDKAEIEAYGKENVYDPSRDLLVQQDAEGGAPAV